MEAGSVSPINLAEPLTVRDASLCAAGYQLTGAVGEAHVFMRKLLVRVQIQTGYPDETNEPAERQNPPCCSADALKHLFLKCLTNSANIFPL